MASSHHVRAEGWLFLKVGDEKGTAKKEYVVIDGFVLRIFKDEPAGAHMEETMVAHEIIDLRMTETLSPVDPYKPHDAVTLVAKSEGGKKKPKSITFESEGQHIAGGHNYDSWWLRHLASAVPDHAVGAALRNARHEATTLAIITNHLTQPSAFKHTDKEWRKEVAALKKKELKAAHSSGSSSSSAPQPQDKGAGGGGNAIADKLAKARAAREHAEDAAPFSSGGSYVDVTDQPASSVDAAPERHLSARQRAEERKMMGLPALPKQETASTKEKAAAAKVQRAYRRHSIEIGTSKAPAAPKPKKKASLEELDEPSQVGEKDNNEWWFVFTDAIQGPFTNGEMRRKYQKGVVHESTLVRFLPFAETKPTIASQMDAPFAPLQECCTATGPPFMDK